MGKLSNATSNPVTVNNSVYGSVTTGAPNSSSTVTISNDVSTTITAINSSRNIWKEETKREYILDKKLRPYIDEELTKQRVRMEDLFHKIQNIGDPLDKQNYIQSFQYTSGFSKALEEVLNIINDPS